MLLQLGRSLPAAPAGTQVGMTACAWRPLLERRNISIVESGEIKGRGSFVATRRAGCKQAKVQCRRSKNTFEPCPPQALAVPCDAPRSAILFPRRILRRRIKEAAEVTFQEAKNHMASPDRATLDHSLHQLECTFSRLSNFRLFSVWPFWKGAYPNTPVQCLPTTQRPTNAGSYSCSLA